jgi:hypothetical protein
VKSRFAKHHRPTAYVNVAGLAQSDLNVGTRWGKLLSRDAGTANAAVFQGISAFSREIDNLASHLP